MTTLYGIPNCDTIKKARQWLKNNNVDYTFHDYKKLGVPEKELKTWVKKQGWEILLNKRGTTWRKLDDAIKKNINAAAAIKIMLQNPSIIKRPVLTTSELAATENKILVGFNADEYEQLYK